jgi:hypothetical protein
MSVKRTSSMWQPSWRLRRSLEDGGGVGFPCALKAQCCCLKQQMGRNATHRAVTQGLAIHVGLFRVKDGMNGARWPGRAKQHKLTNKHLAPPPRGIAPIGANELLQLNILLSLTRVQLARCLLKLGPTRSSSNSSLQMWVFFLAWTLEYAAHSWLVGEGAPSCCSRLVSSALRAMHLRCRARHV